MLLHGRNTATNNIFLTNAIFSSTLCATNCVPPINISQQAPPKPAHIKLLRKKNKDSFSHTCLTVFFVLGYDLPVKTKIVVNQFMSKRSEQHKVGCISLTALEKVYCAQLPRTVGSFSKWVLMGLSMNLNTKSPFQGLSRISITQCWHK